MKICISIAPTAQIPLSETNDIMNLKNFNIARIFTKKYTRNGSYAVYAC